MLIFKMDEVADALAYAAAGRQALHVHTLTRGHPLFARYKEIGHLLDYDQARLVATARRLGVRVIKVEHSGHRGQHIDLCGKPFTRASALASAPVLACRACGSEIWGAEGGVVLKSLSLGKCQVCGQEPLELEAYEVLSNATQALPQPTLFKGPDG